MCIRDRLTWKQSKIRSPSRVSIDITSAGELVVGLNPCHSMDKLFLRDSSGKVEVSSHAKAYVPITSINSGGLPLIVAWTYPCWHQKNRNSTLII